MASSVPVRQFPSFQQQRVENNKGSENRNPRQPNSDHLAGLKNAIKAVQIALLELEAQLSRLEGYPVLIATQSTFSIEALPNLVPSDDPTQLRIYCFGRFQVFLGEEAV